MFEKLYDINNLYQSLLKVSKTSGWKYSTQSYLENALFYIPRLSEKLKNKTYRPQKPLLFLYSERGKTRLIESQCVEDKIVQECLCQYILMPQVMKYVIYDNSSSIKNRGTDFFNKRLKRRLIRWKINHGNNGYIILGDFSKYFDNLDHNQFIQNLRDFKVDEPTIEFVKMLLEYHKLDSKYKNEIYDATKVTKYDKNDRTVEKSMGIGSQLAQVAGIIGAYRIDNYVTKVCGNGNYARYMDDFYCICETKEQAKNILNGIISVSEKAKINLNLRKTQIVKLTRNFSILKRTYKINSNNYLYIKLNRVCYKRERRKIKKMEGLALKEQYESWRGNIVKEFGITRQVMILDDLYLKNKTKKTKIINYNIVSDKEIIL